MDQAALAFKARSAVEKSGQFGAGSSTETWRMLRHPRNAEEVVALHDRLKETTSLRMIPMYRSWYQEILHFFGEQHLEWNYRQQRLQPTRTPRYIPRSTTNLILGRTLTGIGQLLNVPVSGRVHPDDHQQAKDVDGAKAAEKIRKHMWIKNDMADKIEATAFWIEICGNAWMKSFLDSAPKDRHMIEVQNEQTGEMEQQEVRLADLEREVCGPFEMILDWNAVNQGEQYWIVQQRVRSIDWVRDHFGNDAASQVGSEENLGINAWYQFKVRDLLSRGSGRIGTGYNQAMGPHSDLTLESSVLVMEWYEIPSEDYPDGRILITGGGHVLEWDDNYYKKLPFEHFRCIRLPGSIYSFGLVRNAIQINRRLNGLDSQVDLNRKTVNNGCWTAPKRSGFATGVANGTPGAIYEWDPAGTFGFEPKRYAGVGIGGEAFIQRDGMIRDIDDVMLNKGSILSGGQPKGVTSGRGFKLLRDQAREQHIPIRDRFFRSIENMERFGLEIIQMAPAWQIKQAVKIVGTDGGVKVEQFMAGDMNGNIDFRMEQGIRRDETQYARRERLENLAMMGVIDIADPINKSQFLQEMGFEDYNSEIHLDYMKALRETEAIRTGQLVAQPDPQSKDPRNPDMLVPIGEYDNDAIFIRVHQDATKLDEFKTWPQAAKLTLSIKISSHSLRLMKKEEEALVEAMARGETGADQGQPEGFVKGKPGAQPPSPPSSARKPRPDGDD